MSGEAPPQKDAPDLEPMDVDRKADQPEKEGTTSTNENQKTDENSEAKEGDDEAELQPAEVNEALLAQMEEMGFPNNRSIRALYYTEADAVDQAISWLTEHEDEPDLDEPLLVKPKKQMTPDEQKAYVEDLRLKAKARREEEEKKLDQHRERERIRVGREMMAAKKIEEEQARKRLIEERKREKDEERAAREKIRVKLEEDRRERRRKLGLPEDLTEEEKARDEEKKKERLKQEAEAKAKHLGFAKPVGKLEHLRKLLVGMKSDTDDGAFKTACATLLKYLGNIVRNPDEEKYRRIKLGNNAFKQRVASVPGGVEFLEGCGFEKDAAGEVLVLERGNVEMELLSGAGGLINGAIENPFFGKL